MSCQSTFLGIYNLHVPVMHNKTLHRRDRNTLL